jgi:hypothetical protein
MDYLPNISATYANGMELHGRIQVDSYGEHDGRLLS